MSNLSKNNYHHNETLFHQETDSTDKNSKVGNEGVNKDKSLQSQIVDLQASVAYLELTIDSLDKVISKQDKQLQDMQRQLQLMFSHINNQADTSLPAFDGVNEVPPHY